MGAERLDMRDPVVDAFEARIEVARPRTPMEDRMVVVTCRLVEQSERSLELVPESAPHAAHLEIRGHENGDLTKFVVEMLTALLGLLALCSTGSREMREVIEYQEVVLGALESHEDLAGLAHLSDESLHAIEVQERGERRDDHEEPGQDESECP
jgi:hypothetical protein